MSFRLGATAVVLGALLLLALTPGCEARLALGAGCARSSECSAGLVCGIGGRCRTECTTSRDCPLGARCLPGDDGGAPACSLGALDECGAGGACAPRLRCVDGQCLGVCIGPGECPDGRCVDGACEPLASGEDAGTDDGGADDTGATPCEPLPAAADPILDVAVGEEHACGVSASGSAWCWGEVQALPDPSGALDCALGPCVPWPTRVLASDGLPLDALDVAAGSGFSCAITRSTEVRCWGNGPLGDGSISSSRRAVLVRRASDRMPLSGVTAIGAGRVHACALAGGEVWCWGANDRGQLGDGTTAAHYYAMRATELGTGVDSMALTYYGTLALAGGALLGVGEDDGGELGGVAPSSAPGDAITAVLSAIAPIDALAASDDATAILRAGVPLAWGAVPGVPPGSFFEHCAGTCTTTPTAIEVELATPLVGLAGDFAGSYFVGWSAAGALLGWGSNQFTQLRPEAGWSYVERAEPIVALAAPTHRVALGYFAACAIADGTGELWCWGHNRHGQLGRGTFSVAEAMAARVCWR